MPRNWNDVYARDSTQPTTVGAWTRLTSGSRASGCIYTARWIRLARASTSFRSELERRLRSRLNSTNDSWRVDETYIRVKGKWVYLYRAVDSTGATIDFLLSAK